MECSKPEIGENSPLPILLRVIFQILSGNTLNLQERQQALNIVVASDPGAVVSSSDGPHGGTAVNLHALTHATAQQLFIYVSAVEHKNAPQYS
jgi:hypothetical protein